VVDQFKAMKETLLAAVKVERRAPSPADLQAIAETMAEKAVRGRTARQLWEAVVAATACKRPELMAEECTPVSVRERS